MTAHWLSISMGPVQGFIAAARRTRDLWYGSWLLSEVSKAAALALHEQGARIVLPGVASAADLQPDSDLNVTNKILAHIPNSSDPARVFAGAEAAAKKRLRDEADKVLVRIKAFVDEERWQNQIGGFLEIYGAWVPDDGYESRRFVEQLLNGRKALRDFSPGEGAALIPKSSLDAMHESVLKRGSLSEGELRRLDLMPAEQLDAMGFVKRLGQGRRQYPSIGRIAADPWLRSLAQGTLEDQRWLNGFKAVASEVADLAQLNWSQFSHFPYEASVCYPTRVDEVLPAPEDEKLRDDIKGLLARQRGASPYMAVLTADGDRMGALIDSLRSTEEVQGLSRKLSEFASKSRHIVADHHGALVYAGGDDVFAFLPLDKVIGAARELHDTYTQILTPAAGGKVPTLSVGIAVNHYREPLVDVLNRARQAGELAKEPDRNGLALRLQKRSGGQALEVRYRWDDCPDARFGDWISLLEADAVPGKAAYELHLLATGYPKDGDWVHEALQADARRLLKRKEIKDASVLDRVMELLFFGVCGAPDFVTNVQMMLLAVQWMQMSRATESE